MAREVVARAFPDGSVPGTGLDEGIAAPAGLIVSQECCARDPESRRAWAIFRLGVRRLPHPAGGPRAAEHQVRVPLRRWEC
jgi:hypothetical protein